jgi:heme oxygenase
MGVIEQLDDATRSFQTEADAEMRAALADATPGGYRRFLLRVLGFVRSVERALAATPGLERLLDPRRLRKHLLLEADLQTLGVSRVELGRIPVCITVPLFDEPYGALGWAYVVEHSTLLHSELYRYLGLRIPGEIAFASSYLKCYFGAVGEMWRSFADSLETAAAGAPHHASWIVDAAAAGFHQQLHWWNTLDDEVVSEIRDVSPFVASLPSIELDRVSSRPSAGRTPESS